MGWLADRRDDRARLQVIEMQVNTIVADYHYAREKLRSLCDQYIELREALLYAPIQAAEQQVALDAWRAETNIDGLTEQRDSLLARIEHESDSASIHRLAEALSHIIGLIQLANQSKPR